jgi:hypothetical protein
MHFTFQKQQKKEVKEKFSRYFIFSSADLKYAPFLRDGT